MKLTIALLGLVAVVSAARPDTLRQARQNDLPDCVSGEDGPGGTFESEEDCEKECWMQEKAEDDPNIGGLCSGHCVSKMTPQIGPYMLPHNEITCEGSPE